jgi:hypothetical protein
MTVIIIIALLFLVICGVLIYKHGFAKAWAIILAAGAGFAAALYALWEGLTGVPMP